VHAIGALVELANTTAGCDFDLRVPRTIEESRLPVVLAALVTVLEAQAFFLFLLADKILHYKLPR